MIINLKNNQIPRRVKNTERTKLLIDTKTPNTASVRISFLECHLKRVACEKITFGFEILFEQMASFKIGKNFFTLKDLMDPWHSAIGD